MSESTIQASADLILRLYELRRDSEMRAARQWFARDFRPESAHQILELLLSGERASANYRMVTSYWDMVAAMVLRGAIDPELFRDTNGEYLGFFSIIEPHLEDFRAITKETDYLKSWETVVRATPGSAERLESRRRLFAAWTGK